MRYSRILQCVHKEKKRLILSIRHSGYWKRRNYRNPIDIQKQYVSKGKKDSKLRYSSRAFKIQWRILVIGWYKKPNGRYDFKEFEF